MKNAPTSAPREAAKAPDVLADQAQVQDAENDAEKGDRRIDLRREQIVADQEKGEETGRRRGEPLGPAATGISGGSLFLEEAPHAKKTKKRRVNERRTALASSPSIARPEIVPNGEARRRLCGRPGQAARRRGQANRGRRGEK